MITKRQLNLAGEAIHRRAKSLRIAVPIEDADEMAQAAFEAIEEKTHDVKLAEGAAKAYNVCEKTLRDLGLDIEADGMRLMRKHWQRRANGQTES